MTKTPLEEFLEACLAKGHVIEVTEIEVVDAPADRAEAIKAVWATAVLTAPEGILTGPSGPLLATADPHNPGREIFFEIMQYGDKRVVECEGVVVCHLL